MTHLAPMLAALTPKAAGLNQLEIARSRVAMVMAILGSFFILLVYDFFTRNPPIIALITFFALLMVIPLIRRTGYRPIYGIGIMILFEWTSHYHFTLLIKQVGLMNVHLVWSLTFVILSALIGGHYLSFFTMILVTSSKNIGAWAYYHGKPSPDLNVAFRSMVEWNYAIILVFISTWLFEWILFRQFAETTKAQKDLEQERKRATYHSKMAALGHMAAGLAHEINNPLAIIQGHAILLSKAPDPGLLDEKCRRHIDKIIKSTNRIKIITSSMAKLAHNTKEASDKGVYSVKDILSHICSSYNDVLKSLSCSLQIICDPEIYIEINLVAISQVILNIVDNAVDAVKEEQNAWIRIEVQSIQHKVMINLSNSGPLIPKEIEDYIMNPFFTTKSQNKSQGLGLSLSHCIVHAHSGTLGLDQSQGYVSFCLVLTQHDPRTKTILS